MSLNLPRVLSTGWDDEPGRRWGAVAHPLPVLAVAVAMTFLAVMAVRAWLRSRNRYLLFVAAAFTVFAVKSLVTAYALWSGFPRHEDLELVGSTLDLVIAGLLVAPFVLRPR